jgi:hypothetical protein
MAKRTTATTRILHRINESLAGTDLFTYTRGVFEVLGLNRPKTKGVKPGNLSCFYNSASIVRHHLANKNFVKKDGKLLLTAKGRAHFDARIEEEVVNKKEASGIAKALRSGKPADLPADWKGEVTFSEVTVAK